MEKFELDKFTGGWFIGNFIPSLHVTLDFEVGVKFFNKGSTELEHYQLKATEYSCVISGKCRIGDTVLGPHDILRINPLESADFFALEDTVIVVVKLPSIPEDKVLGSFK